MVAFLVVCPVAAKTGDRAAPKSGAAGMPGGAVPAGPRRYPHRPGRPGGAARGREPRPCRRPAAFAAGGPAAAECTATGRTGQATALPAGKAATASVADGPERAETVTIGPARAETVPNGQDRAETDRPRYEPWPDHNDAFGPGVARPSRYRSAIDLPSPDAEGNDDADEERNRTPVLAKNGSPGVTIRDSAQDDQDDNVNADMSAVSRRREGFYSAPS